MAKSHYGANDGSDTALERAGACPYVEVRMFGAFEFTLPDGSALDLHAAKDKWLLALLLLAKGKPVQRDLLSSTLWPFPDFDTNRAGANLRRGLWLLRQALGAQVWRLTSPTPDTVSLDLSGMWVDVIEFDNAITRGDLASLERAVSLHRAPLLQVCTEEWLEFERDRRREHLHRAVQAVRAEASSARAATVIAACSSSKETLVENSSESRDSWRRTEPEGGAVPLDSPYYIVRATDAAFAHAIERRDSVVLVKGARETGKTSLLARGIQAARAAGSQVVLTDFQTLTAHQLASAEDLFFTLAGVVADQLDLKVAPEEIWNPRRGWNVNFERFLRRNVLATLQAPLVWAIDEVDRLFGHPFSAEVFGLFRSWHNQRALDPTGPWGRFTLAMAYATEAHLFISDLNQSPFNVGTRMALEDFTAEQVRELNRRYTAPLTNESEESRFYNLVGGHPALVRRGLHALSMGGATMTSIETTADAEDGIFGAHLRRMLSDLRKDASLCTEVRNLIEGGDLSDTGAFYRLRSAGILIGGSPDDARFRCTLYERYLSVRLR